ncbi:DMT family transporter [Pseudooceanicola sp.]|uniref:DMT family transporter n=1 Tax=Pseudooceanicola sp. TaxID=1914328 RepID=UPI004058139D
MTKARIDAQGAALLILISLILGANQVVMKLTSEGLSPVFQSGLRSVVAAACVALWILVRRVPFPVDRAILTAGLWLGVLFAFEFVCLYVAVDLTSVSHVSIMFYTMPVHLSLMAHFLLPGERLTRAKSLGLVLCLIAVVVVMSDQRGGEVNLLGDVIAFVGAIGWAAVGILLRASAMSRVPGEATLLWQLGVSSPILLVTALFFGPLVRDFAPVHIWLMAYQVVAVALFSFMAWLLLIRIYPASTVASFSFLTPVFSVIFAFVILGEPLRASVLAGLALVATGIYLINRPQVPQKVA